MDGNYKKRINLQEELDNLEWRANYHKSRSEFLRKLGLDGPAKWEESRAEELKKRHTNLLHRRTMANMGWQWFNLKKFMSDADYYGSFDNMVILPLVYQFSQTLLLGVEGAKIKMLSRAVVEYRKAAKSGLFTFFMVLVIENYHEDRAEISFMLFGNQSSYPDDHYLVCSWHLVLYDRYVDIMV